MNVTKEIGAAVVSLLVIVPKHIRETFAEWQRVRKLVADHFAQVDMLQRVEEKVKEAQAKRWAEAEGWGGE